MAITQMESVPYKSSLPIARYWYGDMLAACGQTAEAKAMLKKAIADGMATGMALYVRLAQQRFLEI